MMAVFTDMLRFINYVHSFSSIHFFNSILCHMDFYSHASMQRFMFKLAFAIIVA